MKSIKKRLSIAPIEDAYIRWQGIDLDSLIDLNSNSGFFNESIYIHYKNYRLNKRSRKVNKKGNPYEQD
jgi:hypothetical protein